MVRKSFLKWKIDAKIEKTTNLRRSYDDLKMTKLKIQSRYDTAQSIIFKTPCRRSRYLFWFSRYKILRFFAKEILKFQLKTVIRQFENNFHAYSTRLRHSSIDYLQNALEVSISFGSLDIRSSVFPQLASIPSMCIDL